MHEVMKDQDVSDRVSDLKKEFNKLKKRLKKLEKEKEKNESDIETTKQLLVEKQFIKIYYDNLLEL